ncbi:MAG: peptidase S9 [Niabella sp. SCN 42-15]|nr:MAG: peptidase S9 [Niabella sp. SCN 42-15]
MKKIIVIALAFSATVLQAQTAKQLTKEDYAAAEKMLGKNTFRLTRGTTVNAQWLPDGRFWYENPSAGEYILVNPSNGSKKHSQSLQELIGSVPEKKAPARFRNEAVSPDGKKTVFIKDWNLWVKDNASQKETQLTTDGIKDFGYATDNAGWTHSDRPIVKWSPDSKKIATFRQDQRHLKDMYLVKTKVGAPELQQWKYPLPGDKEIAKIYRVIVDVDPAKVIPLRMGADDHRSTFCDDISCEGGFTDNEWNDESTQLAFISSSRDHKQANFRVADAATGEVRSVYEEKVPTQYESGRDGVSWRFLPNSNEFIWYSQRDNWGHLYLYDLKTGKLKNQITKGDFVVMNIIKVDEKKRLIYFTANGREANNNPYFTHFYSIGFDGKNLKWLTPAVGDHSISLSPDNKYFVDTYSQPDVAPVSVLRDINGKQVVELEKTDISMLSAAGWKPPTPFTVKSATGRFDLYGLMYAPTKLDASKKYPVVVYIYPGPQAGSVGSWAFSPARGDHQALAELGFVVVQLEGSCNPGRSKAFHDACYGNMGENTLPDHIEGLKQLAKKYPYLDLDKVGIWGHSGGGFATAAALLRYPDFFKVGVSQSGNHDNRNYEDDWGERYIGLLTKDANGKDNYESQANQTYAKNLKGKLLIAHGGMDDNVPPYNAYLLVDALIKANKDFDLLIFPNARHGYGADNNYMMRRRWDYFVKNLMGAEPPKEYLIK